MNRLRRHDDFAVAEINPVMLRMARLSRGMSITGLARLIPGLGYRRLKAQENWNPRELPPQRLTRSELRQIAELLHYPETFFKQWDVVHLVRPISIHGRPTGDGKV